MTISMGPERRKLLRSRQNQTCLFFACITVPGGHRIVDWIRLGRDSTFRQPDESLCREGSSSSLHRTANDAKNRVQSWEDVLLRNVGTVNVFTRKNCPCLGQLHGRNANTNRISSRVNVIVAPINLYRTTFARRFTVLNCNSQYLEFF